MSYGQASSASKRWDVERDRYDRPLIVPPEGGEPVPYMRASKIAKILSEEGGLTWWKQILTAYGMSIRPDLVEVASAIGDYYDPDSFDRKRASGVVREAFEAGGGNRQANRGTGVHAWCEAVDQGRELKKLPARLKPVIDAYARATQGLTVVDAEQFVVVDQLRVGGQYDSRRHWSGSPSGLPVTCDIKTGKDAPKYAHEAAIQMACYSRGVHYRDGVRTPYEVDQSVGLLIHLPVEEGAGTCRLYALDLNVAWGMAQVAMHVHAWRQMDVARPI